jgi:hypothetical protein
MDERLRKAYYDYLDGLARSGVVDHALDIAILEGKSVEDHVVEVLGAAGRLPAGWDDEPKRADLAAERQRRVG